MWPAPTEGDLKYQKDSPYLLHFSRLTGGKELKFSILSNKAMNYEDGRIEIEVSDADICLAFCGGVGEEYEAMAKRYLDKPELLLKENERYENEFQARTTEVRTSNPLLDEAFYWAKAGLDKCFVETALGKGFVAGYHMAGDGNRPGFAWYFGRDSFWMGLAFLSIGDFSKVKDNLLLQKRFQIKEGNNKGKIYHELSLAHSFVPDPSYSYVAGDSTPLYVILCSEYAKWSGDREFLRENWESIKDAMDWCERMDVDGDLLIDNPPAGHQWFDDGEKNMIDLVAIWQKALEEGAYIARLLGKEDLARKWEDKARKVNRILNEDFWNAKRNFFYDRKLPDGSFLDLATCNPLIPLLWREIEEDKAETALSYFASPSFTTDWGVRTTSKDERIYNPWGYHDGTVWPLVTGWASWAQFVNCHPIDGYANLLRNAKMTRDFCLGYIPEILNGDRYEAGGCPLQGWSEAMVILPLLRGMLGLEPNALEKRIKMTMHIPEEIAFLKLTNITVGDSKWEIEWKNEGRRASLKIKKEEGSTYFIELAISMKAIQQAEAISDGKRIALEKINKPCGYHILLRSSVDKELSVNFSKR